MNEFVKTWLPGLSTLLGIGASLATYWVRLEAKSAIAGTAAKVSERMDEHHDRIIKLEAAMETLPTRDDFHKLSIANADMIGEMKAMKETIKAMHETVTATQRSVQRINDYLLEKKTA